MRTGVPAALQFAMDVFAFTFFIFMVGRLGKVELAASNIAFSMESIAFMPAFGFSIGLSTLVGQALGRNDVAGAIRYTRQTIVILLSYILLIDLLFFLAPQWVIKLFATAEGTGASYEQILDQGVELGFIQIISQLHRVAAIRTAVANSSVQGAVGCQPHFGTLHQTFFMGLQHNFPGSFF